MCSIYLCCSIRKTSKNSSCMEDQMDTTDNIHIKIEYIIDIATTTTFDNTLKRHAQ